MKTRVCLTVLSGMLLTVAAASHAAPAPAPGRFREIAFLKGTLSVSCVAFSPDGKRLATADYGREGVRLWDVATRKVARVLPHRDANRVQFSPDGKIVATASRHVKLWDAASGKELTTFKFVTANALVFSPDGHELAAVAKGVVTIFSIEEKKELRSYDIDRPRRLISGYPSLKKPVFALLRGKGKPIALIDVFTGKEVAACENRLDKADPFAVDREEKILAAFCGDSLPRGQFRYEVVLWDRDKGKKIATVDPVVGALHVLALSPDGKVLVVYSHVLSVSMEACGLRFYEVSSGRLLHFQPLLGVFSNPNDYDDIHGLVFSPDGRVLATVQGNGVSLWSIPEAWRKKK
jgi:WD40 repeat protein